MTPETKKEEIKTILISIYRRVGISTAKKILGNMGLDTSLGWDSLVEELLEDTTKHDHLHKSLLTVLKSLLMFGSRLFECYEFDHEKVDNLKALLDESKPEGFLVNSIVDIDKKQLTDEFSLFAKEESDNCLTYYFLHYAECTEQVILEQSAIKESYYDEGFDKIIAKTKGKKVFVNTVRIEKHLNKIYVMIDRADEIGLSDLRRVKGDFTNHINSIYELNYGELFFNHKINLFDKVELLYDDVDLGVVSELKFLCPSGTSRHEKLSQRGELNDLREEVYHKAGMEKIDYIIDPFYIAMDFEFGNLSLLGRKYMINNLKNRPLTEGVLRKAYSDDKYTNLLKVLNDA
ncbi:hypothetical protein [Vibrio diabolicus]|uniref:hypothetical protein n=1 Tax=Vibrio diabolicus TaxID=50719 RepID=UPI00215109A5|nr:hypothetical protein [Vibrio diabolicus]MCE9831057.1 hypothetical protein [Vibrio diabolicus]MCS0453218.1 hypothetical protein [Vibrio diabolicus]